MATEGGQAALLIDEAGNFVGISLDGAVYRLEVSTKSKNTGGNFVDPATEGKQDDAITKLTSLDGKDFATQTTLATLATETKLEAVRSLLSSLDGKDYATQTTLAVLAGKDFATQTTLATLATETTLTAIGALLTSIDGKDFATQTTLAAADARLATIDAVLDSIKDTDGIKKITDELPAGTQEIGAVKQGTKALPAAAWPIVQVDSAGNYATITLDQGVYRQEISGKVAVTGAEPPPATTPVVIYADTPLVVGTHDTTYLIPTGDTYHLQQITAGNEDPTKGAVSEVIFDDGTEHVIERVYTNGETISIGYSDVTVARDGTSLVGNGTNTIIVRRTKFSGTNIAVDTEVRGYLT